MLKSNWKLFSYLERVLDNLVLVVSFLLSYYLGPLFAEDFNGIEGIYAYTIVLGIALPVYNASLSFLGAYYSRRFRRIWLIVKFSVFVGISGFFFIAALLFIAKIDLSRSFIGIFCFITTVLLLIERLLVMLTLHWLRRSGYNYRNILIVGTGKQALCLYKESLDHHELGIRVVGFYKMDGDVDDVSEFVSTVKIIEGEEKFERFFKKEIVDEVMFSELGLHSISYFEKLIKIASDEGMGVSLAGDFLSLKLRHSELGYIGNIPLIRFSAVPGTPTALACKRLIDITISLFVLIVFAPVYLVIAFFIVRESGFPVLFSQERVGLNGRLFRLLKFRSMVVDAEDIKETLEEQNEMYGPVFKLKNDPRVTKVGHFLRQWSLDELPQFWNVLCGSMSIVGPRPPLPDEVDKYHRTQKRRLSMRPGITCIWQVSGRNKIPDFNTWAKLDLQYIDNWTLGKDFRLMLQTIPAVLKRDGAR